MKITQELLKHLDTQEHIHYPVKKTNLLYTVTFMSILNSHLTKENLQTNQLINSKLAKSIF